MQTTHNTERAEAQVAQYDRLYIGGEWVEPAGGTFIDSYNPATGAVWARVAEATAPDVDRAVEAARAALDSAAWRDLPATERGNLIYRLAEAVAERSEELAQLESRDSGLTIRDARGDLKNVVNWLRYYAGFADKIEGLQVPVRSDWHAYTVREPVGVVGAIIPWNAPLNMSAWKLGPALAAGCTVVLKPAEQTPVTALVLAEVVDHVGFPPGVVNVVTGYGKTAGAALAAHPKVDKIAFTGEHTTAQSILTAAAKTLTRVSAECGGKAPHVVFADGDVERAVDATANAVFRRTGQSCALGSRIFVQRGPYDDFVEGLARRARSLRVGDPLDERTYMGPHTSAEQREKTERYVSIGRDEGARLVAGGGRPEGEELAAGFFTQPAVFADVDNAMRIAQEEIFGPVASVIPFDDEADLIEQANDTIYGLSAGIWTRDVKRAHRVAARIRAGSVWVNVYPAAHWTLPFGGTKLSGMGRENGREALELYTEVKTVVVDLSEDPGPSPFGD